MRRGLALLPLGLLLLAAAEIAVFVAAVNTIGAFYALLIVLASSVAGLALLRREGARGWRAFRAAAEAGRPPGNQISNSLIGLLGALLLAVPGFVTALAGLLLVLPPGRILARRGLQRAAERRVSSAAAGDLFGPRHVRVRQAGPVDDASAASAPPVEGEVVEGEIVR